tara:strand:- start:23 stop:610 length:588 start_codon:yes stop_codon:yes gene_type:complete
VNSIGVKVKNLERRLEAIGEWMGREPEVPEDVMQVICIMFDWLQNRKDDFNNYIDYHAEKQWSALKDILRINGAAYLTGGQRYLVPAQIEATIEKLVDQFRFSMEDWERQWLPLVGFCPFIVNRRVLNDFDTQDNHEVVLFDRWLDRHCAKLRRRLIASLREGIWDGTEEGIKYIGDRHPIQPPRMIGMYEHDRA